MALSGMLTVPQDHHEDHGSLAHSHARSHQSHQSHHSNSQSNSVSNSVSNNSHSLLTSAHSAAHSLPPSLQYPSGTIELSNMVHPQSTFTAPPLHLQALPSTPKTGLLVPTHLTDTFEPSILTHLSHPGHSHDDQSVQQSVQQSVTSTCTKNSKINADGDQREEVDRSLPPEEFSVTKTIVRAIAGCVRA